MGHEILLQKVLEELRKLKSDLPDGDRRQILKTLSKVEEDIRDLKLTLLHPEDGVIVKVNRNTEFREEEISKQPQQLIETSDISELKKWKDTITKILWIILTAMIGIGLKLLFYM